MVVLILFNPVAGGGGTEAAAVRLAEALRRAGRTLELCPTGADPDDRVLEEGLRGAEALLVVGGDGAVRFAADAAIRTRTPLYHVPSGTENLFAREFGTSGGPAVLEALERRRIAWLDAGLANGVRFLLMASIGYDAEVVHDLSARRGAAITHWSYVGPMARQLRRWRAPALDVTADGRSLRSGPGQIIVANCRQYMWRLNPAPQADMTDGKLDVVYFPARRRAELLGWIRRCAMRRALTSPQAVFERASSVRITCSEPQHVQVDGDPLGGPGEKTGQLDVTVEPGVLPVLLPAENHQGGHRAEP